MQKASIFRALTRIRGIKQLPQRACLLTPQTRFFHRNLCQLSSTQTGGTEQDKAEKHAKINTNTPQDEKKNFYQKTKDLIRKYGATGVAVYSFLYFGTGVAVYYCLQNNILPVEKVHKWVGEYITVDKSDEAGFLPRLVGKIDDEKKALNILLSWFATEAFEPVRFPLTLLLTPLIIKLIKRR
ncbi:hypothetical protein AKO1_015680 [Acrasis kona]|uniref:DUF1279 domain-containing protein n=1 Tax=Acrasis kona TaxID=1008807 RepID=A0AAW2ZFQ9_9EUKA